MEKSNGRPGRTIAAAVRTRAQHLYFTTFDMCKSTLNMHKSFLARLGSLRMDEPLRVWYSIVTERKQPEIRSQSSKRSYFLKGEDEKRLAGRIRKEGGSSPMANFKDPIHNRRARAC